MVANEYRTLAAEQRLLADASSLSEVRRLFLQTAANLELLAAELEQSELAASRLRDKRRRLDGFGSDPAIEPNHSGSTHAPSY